MRSLTRLDRVATVQARIGWKALTADEYEDDGYAFLSTPNIKGAAIDFENVNYITEHRYEESPELKLALGDVLLAKDGSTLGITNWVSSLPRPATVNGSIAVLRPYAIDPAFLTYWLKGAVIQGSIQRLKDGMGVPHLFQQDIKRLPVPNLPYDAQRRIADFLDDRVARIDRIIAARRQQIDLQDGLVVAELSRTLLTPQASTVPLRQLILSETLGLWGGEPGGDEVDVFVARVADFDRPRFALGNVSTVRSASSHQVESRALQPGDVLLERSGGTARNPVGCPAFIGELTGTTVCSNFVSRLRPAVGVDGRYLSLMLGALYATRQHSQFSTQATGIMNLNSSQYFSFHVPGHSHEEMSEIGRRVDLEMAMLRQRQGDLQRSIDLLTEYKSSLITAAVTGELDVTTASRRIPGA